MGEKLALDLKKGSVVALLGPLGSGKTSFAQGICQGLGVTENITSPTFTLLNQYPGNLWVYHFDLFRILDEEDLEKIGLDEYLYGEGVCIVEWAEKAKSFLPENTIWVNFQILSEQEREVILKNEFHQLYQ